MVPAMVDSAHDPAGAPVSNLYVHVPFCTGKCAYCGLYSVVAPAAARRRYAPLPALELARTDVAVAPRTIYFGGGTPGRLGVAGWRTLVASLGALVPLSEAAEWSVELHPAGFTAPLISAMLRAGVNRFSLGVQSLDDDVLRRLGRRHDAATALRAVRRLRAAGCANLGIDLIAGLPGVTPDGWRETLRRVVDLGLEHLSVYALTLEPRTRLARQAARGLRVPAAAAQLEALDAAEAALTAAGFERYEISNYARPGRACQHNLACWRGEDYLGLGPSAASRVGRRRWTNTADWEGYVHSLASGGLPPRHAEWLAPVEDASERFLFGLRLAEGVDPAAFAARYPAAAGRVGAWRHALSRLVAPGIVTRQEVPERWRLTARGREVADAVLRELV